MLFFMAYKFSDISTDAAYIMANILFELSIYLTYASLKFKCSTGYQAVPLLRYDHCIVEYMMHPSNPSI